MGVETVQRNPSLRKALSADVTNRSLRRMLRLLNIQPSQLKGRILEIGSGNKNRFAETARKKYEADIISVNPQLILSTLRKKSKSPQIAALAQALPFKDSSFDTIVSSFSVPFYIPVTELAILYKEIIRVLQPGGVAYLSPMSHLRNKVADTRTALSHLHAMCSYEISSIGYGMHRYRVYEDVNPKKLTIHKL